MKKRYQVFVSSTYEDLKDERQAVMHVLMELDCIPAGMELFPATNEDQWTLIKRVIEESDYYLVISAGRYGSISGDGMSYTEREYRYAIDRGVPVMGFLHKDPTKLPEKYSEPTSRGKQSLNAFQEFMKNKVCKLWGSAPELGSAVSTGLIRLQESFPRIGWVRASNLAQEDARSEIVRLRKQNEALEHDLLKLRNAPPRGAERLEQGDAQFTVHFHCQGIRNRHDQRTIHREFTTTWNSVFGAIAPVLLDEIREIDLSRALDHFVDVSNQAALRNDPHLKGLKFNSFVINPDDFHTIKIQLRELGLIRKSRTLTGGTGSLAFWIITPPGESVMIRLRAIHKKSMASGSGLALTTGLDASPKVATT